MGKASKFLPSSEGATASQRLRRVEACLFEVLSPFAFQSICRLALFAFAAIAQLDVEICFFDSTSNDKIQYVHSA